MQLLLRKYAFPYKEVYLDDVEQVLLGEDGAAGVGRVVHEDGR